MSKLQKYFLKVKEENHFKTIGTPGPKKVNPVILIQLTSMN